MLIIVNHKGGIRIGSSGLRVIGSGNIISIKRQYRIPLRINRDRLAGLLESQARFIRIPDLYRDTTCSTGVIQRQQAAIAPVGFTRKRDGRRARRTAGQLQRKRHGLRAAPGGAELFGGRCPA